MPWPWQWPVLLIFLGYCILDCFAYIVKTFYYTGIGRERMARAYATSIATSSQVVSYSMYIMPARGIHFIRYGNRIVLLRQIFKCHIVWKYWHIVLSNVLILYCIIVIQWKTNTDIISYSILQSTFLITYVFHNWNRGWHWILL